MPGSDDEMYAAREELANVYFDAGRFIDAQRIYAQVLPEVSSRDTPRGLAKLFGACRQGDENIAAFTAQLRAQFQVRKAYPPVKDFAYVTLDGAHGTLGALRGNVVVIDFWFLGCQGCMLEKDALNNLADEFAADSGVSFLSIALTDSTTLRKFLKQHPTKWPTVADANVICESADIDGYPTHYIIGRDGTTLYRDTGGGTTTDASLLPKIKAALAAH